MKKEKRTRKRIRNFFAQNKSVPVAILALAVTIAMGFVLAQKGNILTFLGGLTVPPPGQGASLMMFMNVGDTVAKPGSSTWYGEIAQNQNVSVRVVYVPPANNPIPLSALDAVVKFDPQYFEVTKDPEKGSFAHLVRANFDNTNGLVEFAVGSPYPGTTYQSSDSVTARTIGSFTLHPKKMGSTNISFDYGSSRGAGLSRVVVVDDGGATVDILDSVQNQDISVLDPVPVISSTDIAKPARAVTNTGAETKIYLTGKHFGPDSVVIVSSTASCGYTFTPSYISQDGTSLIFAVPPTLGGSTISNCGPDPVYGTFNLGVTSAGARGWSQGNTPFVISSLPTDSTAKYYPAIDTVVPSKFSANVETTQTITITGTKFNFVNGTLKIPVTGAQIISANHFYTLSNIAVNAAGTQVTATIPKQIEPGQYDLQVLYDSRAGTNGTNDTLPSALTFGEVPKIVTVFPSQISTDDTNGLQVNIDGFSFGNDKTKVSATLSGPQNATLEVQDVVTTDQSFLIAKSLNTLQQGDYDVTLSVDGISYTAAKAFKVLGPVTPTIISVSPSSLDSDYAAGTKVQLFGNDLQRVESVSFKNGAQIISAHAFAVASIENGNKTKIDVTLPENLSVGAYDVLLVLSNGQSTTYPAGLMLNAPVLPPIVSGVAPDSVTDGYSGEPSLTVTGADFGTAPRVTLEGPQSYTLTTTQASDTQITATIPGGMAVGKYKALVSARGKTGTLENAFEVKEKPAPTISSVTPSILEITYPDNTPVTIAGTNFRSNSKVKLIGPAEHELSNPSVNGDFTQIQATLPAGIQPGTYKLMVYSDGGPTVTAEIVFIITQTPQKVMAPVVANTSNVKNATQLSASWTLPAGSSQPEYYQYRILDNGNEIRAWDADKIQLATTVTAKGLKLGNGHSYVIQVRGVNAAGPGEVGISSAVVTRSANLDFDANEKVGLGDLQILGKSFGRKDKPMADINQNGIVSIDDLGILLSYWNP